MCIYMYVHSSSYLGNNIIYVDYVMLYGSCEGA